jgi:nucleoid-associated protein YgaU
MVMSEKVAMFVCIAVIIGTPCGLQWFAAPSQVPSPLGVGRPAVPAAADRGPVSDLDPRLAWVRRLQRPNPFEAQAALNRTTDALALMAPSEPPLLAPGPSEVLADSAEAALAAADVNPIETPASEVRRYRVAKGDTLMKIARREWNSDDRRLIALLGEANPQVRERKNHIRIGEELVIPDAARVQIALGTGPTMPSAAAQTEIDAAVDPAATDAARWYTIRRKDTLASIARRFLNDSGRWREIVVLNGALNPRRIVPGMRIKLPPMLRLAQN